MKANHGLVFLFLLSLFSCEDDKNHLNMSNEFLPLEEKLSTEGIYSVKLFPLNQSVAGLTSGEVKAVIKGDDIIFQGEAQTISKGIRHFLFVLSGSECPLEVDDKNKDSLLDISEVFYRSGEILIPLDSDPSDQLLGFDFAPISNSSGEVRYRRSAPLSKLLSDLVSLDPDPFDNLIKITEDSQLDLSKRVIVILGINREVNLPRSVAALGENMPHESFPIACGRFERILNND